MPQNVQNIPKAPLKITNADKKNACNLKCAFGFNYPSVTQVYCRNSNGAIEIKNESQGNSPVTYNSKQYTLESARIVHPSLHTYNGNTAAAEIIMVHTNIATSSTLLVCVPIVEAPSTSQFVADIISNVSKYAPGSSDDTTTTRFDVELNKIVPKSPFFAYNGSLPYPPFTSPVELIVFEPSNTQNYISASDYTKLSNLIVSTQIDYAKLRNSMYKLNSKNQGTAKKNQNIIPKIFYNNGTGPTVNSGDDNILIDCQPVNSEGTVVEEKKVGPSVSPFSSDFTSQNATLLIVIGLTICFILVLALISKISKINNLPLAL